MEADTGELDPLAVLDAEMEARMAWRERRERRRLRIRQSAMILASWVVAFTPVWVRWLPGM